MSNSIERLLENLPLPGNVVGFMLSARRPGEGLGFMALETAYVSLLAHKKLGDIKPATEKTIPVLRNSLVEAYKDYISLLQATTFSQQTPEYMVNQIDQAIEKWHASLTSRGVPVRKY